MSSVSLNRWANIACTALGVFLVVSNAIAVFMALTILNVLFLITSIGIM
jgi:hypothetical protein